MHSSHFIYRELRSIATICFLIYYKLHVPLYCLQWPKTRLVPKPYRLPGFTPPTWFYTAYLVLHLPVERRPTYEHCNMSLPSLYCAPENLWMQLYLLLCRWFTANVTTFLIDYIINTLHNVPMWFWNQVTLVLYLGCLQWTEIWKL